jgi:glycopeptide antibiotics resistance protein
MIAAVVLVLLTGLVGVFVPRRHRFAVWCGVILAGVIPWFGWVGHPHWSRILWVPQIPPVPLRDAVVNVLLYVPFGYFFVAPAGAAMRRPLWGIACAVAFSVVTEATQIYSHGRFPSMGDVMTNTLGACIGAAAAALIWRPRR